MFQFLALSNPVTLGIAAVATIGFFLYKSNKDKEEQIEASKEELERKMAYYRVFFSLPLVVVLLLQKTVILKTIFF